MMSFIATQSAMVQADTIRPGARQDYRVSMSRGSLPLKKRKLHHVAVTCDQPSPMSDIPSSSRSIVHEGEKAAALALVAAASGFLTEMTPAGPPLGPGMALSQAAAAADRTSPLLTTSFMGSTEQVYIHDFGRVGPSPVTPVSTEMQDASRLTQGSQRQRIHHPPLSDPLPNGCHGRTSRNNSFCRRTPCYNGSTYCKLHYQQYIVAGTRLPAAEPSSISEPSSVTSTPTSAHQDKRFTGCGDDVRCIATTTRGRACAYISINDSKYCHLHADYDTNPPPRRGGGNSSASSPSKSRQMSLTEAGLEILPRMQGCPPIPDISIKRFSLAPLKPTLMPLDSDDLRRSPSSVSSDDSFDVSKSADTHSSSPQASNEALLSSISSDKWLDRKVMIATGPFVHRTGVVEKWGNGWVTVRLHERLTHNRRSVELFLVPEGSSSRSDEEAAIKEEQSELIIPPSVSYENDVMEGDTSTSPVNTSTTSQYQCRGEGVQTRPHSVSYDDSHTDGNTPSEVEDAPGAVSRASSYADERD